MKDTLFFVKLNHAEGEFALGLARRTFNMEKDIPGQEYEVQWFVRKGKRASWGMQPAFKLASGVDRQRRSVLHCDVVPIDAFADIPVEVTRSSAARKNSPVLSKNCMAVLRSLVLGSAESDSPQEEIERGGELSTHAGPSEGRRTGMRHFLNRIVDSSDEDEARLSEGASGCDVQCEEAAVDSSDEEIVKERKRRRSCKS